MNESFSDIELVEFYDLINSGKEDLNFFLAQSPLKSAKILDVGCGTGELAIEFVKRGHEVVAIDPEPTMINCCKKKLKHQRLHWEVGDLPSFIEDLRLEASNDEASNFGMITMTGHAFQNLLSDQDILSFFKSIYQILSTDGYFMFESRNPELRSWEKWDQHCDQFDLPSGEPLEVVIEVISYRDEVLEFQEVYTIGKEKRIKKSSSRLRFADHSTLLSLAEQAGLQLLHLWGDWQNGLFSPHESKEMIFKLGRKQ